MMHCAAGVWAPGPPPSHSTCSTLANGFNVTVASGNFPVRASRGGGTVSGFVLGTPSAPKDSIANGLRSGTYLGGIGTGGYELRADGTLHLSTIRNQSPASEPWQ